MNKNWLFRVSVTGIILLLLYSVILWILKNHYIKGSLVENQYSGLMECIFFPWLICKQFKRTTSHHSTKGVQISSNSSTFCWIANWLSQLLISKLLGIMDIYIIGNRFWNGFWLSKQNIWVQVPCRADISGFGCAYGFRSIWWLDLLFEFGHLDFVATENTTSPLKGILFGPIFRENQVGECSKKKPVVWSFQVPSNSSRAKSKLQRLEPVQVVKSKASRLQQTMYRGRCCSVGGASIVNGSEKADE